MAAGSPPAGSQVPHRTTPYDCDQSPENSFLPRYDSLAMGDAPGMSSGESTLSKFTHEKLLRWSTRVIAFLNNLTQIPSVQASHSGNPKKCAMPLSAFAKPKALAFVFRKGYGLGLFGLLNEVGFVTRKIVHEDGRVSWSAPYFLTGRGFSVGLTIGKLATGYCLALLTDEAVERCLMGDIKFGAQVRFFIDMDGAYVRPTRMDSTNETDNVIDDGHGGLFAKYFRLEAMMVTMAFSWARNVPYRRLNDSTYGTGVPQNEVLGGTVPCPSEFGGVMDLLNRLSVAGDAQIHRRTRGRNAGMIPDRSLSGRDRSTSRRGMAS